MLFLPFCIFTSLLLLFLHLLPLIPSLCPCKAHLQCCLFLNSSDLCTGWSLLKFHDILIFVVCLRLEGECMWHWLGSEVKWLRDGSQWRCLMPPAITVGSGSSGLGRSSGRQCGAGFSSVDVPGTELGTWLRPDHLHFSQAPG